MALWESGLLPQKITGASAGGLVGAALASNITPYRLREILYSARKHHFWDPYPGLGYLRGRKFLSFLKEHLVASFSETQIPIELAVFDVLSAKTRFLDTGSLPQAVAATCAVPLMFHPVKIDKKFYFDGGIFRKSGMRNDDANERILCVYLESEGLSGVYEKKISFKTLSEHHKVLRFKGLPRVAPHTLGNGELALNEAYRRACLALDFSITATFVNA